MSPELKDFLADTVTNPRWASKVLRRLFSEASGVWVSVTALCEQLPDASGSYELFIQEKENGIVASWLPYPFQPTDSYLVIFFDNDELMSTLAVVTKHCLDTLGIMATNPTAR